MQPFFLHFPPKHSQEDPTKLPPPHEPHHDTTEGSEFLDDAIRMHDQPLMYTEEHVAAGSPENLL